MTKRPIASALLLALACALTLQAACSSSKPRQTERVAITPRAIPEALRGTIGSLAQSNAGEPMVVSGFGLVVGLNGTGGGLLDERIAATMEREMQLKGVGAASDVEGTSLEDPLLRRPKSPAELLRDKNVAVVMVQAVLPRGAPANYPFDVYIQAMNATSLEGGRLWSTDLRLGPATVFGAIQTRLVGQARGEVFINPFEDPAESSEGTMRTVGRVLAGGRVTEPMAIRLDLDVPSHSRARQIAHVVNSRFPEPASDREPAARGRDDSVVQLHVPQSYEDRPNEFLKIVEHLPVEQNFPQELSRRYVATLIDTPEMNDDMTWCLVALGDPALPFVRELYENSDTRVRMAALRAGTLLGDVRAAPPLLDMAKYSEASVRNDAISLLGELDGGPTIDEGLRAMLDSPSLTTRTAAYESLARRAERAEYSRLLAIEAQRPASSGMARTPEELRVIAKHVIPARTLQGIRRVTIPGKFVLDWAPFGDPLVYVTQQGTPRIVLFGRDLEIIRPLLASAWSDRLMIVADSASESPRLRYEDYRTGQVFVDTVTSSLPQLIIRLAKDPEPEDDTPGLGMSYSEVVGALYAIYDAGAMRASFATETDRLMAELVEAARTGRVLERPETSADQTKNDDNAAVDASYLKAERARRPEVVPLEPKEPKK
ncbi:MAG: flagellar basal body P-ring protein FlgI [Phycisphaerales bacterium]|nr:flagellar basal body P-ring protein FlgI [Phycisphaerales bacterium]